MSEYRGHRPDRPDDQTWDRGIQFERERFEHLLNVVSWAEHLVKDSEEGDFFTIGQTLGHLKRAVGEYQRLMQLG